MFPVTSKPIISVEPGGGAYLPCLYRVSARLIAVPLTLIKTSLALGIFLSIIY
jgi:hypothetical protein